LMVAMWMSMASLAGIWLWVSGGLRSFRGISLLWFLVPLVMTTVLCKSAGALTLLLAGLLLLLWVRRFQTRAPIYMLSVAAPLYILVRVTGIWSGTEFVEVAKVVSSDRAGSLATRLRQEDLLSDKALKRPVFGWGGWGRSRISDESGRDIVATDGLWILEFGQRGFFGLVAMLGVFLLPVIALVRRIPAREWTRPWAAPAAALTTVVALYLIDCIANAHITPVFILVAGGVTGLMAYRAPILEPVIDDRATGISGS